MGFTRKPAGQPTGLIRVLLDRGAPDGDRDDAAMDLASYDEAAAEDALIAVASDPRTSPDLADTAGESLGEVWLRKGRFDASVVLRLQPAARRMVIGAFWKYRPDWVTEVQRVGGVNVLAEYWEWLEQALPPLPDYPVELPEYLRRVIPGFSESPEIAHVPRNDEGSPGAVLATLGLYLARMQGDALSTGVASPLPFDALNSAAVTLEKLCGQAEPDILRWLQSYVFAQLRSDFRLRKAFRDSLGPKGRSAFDNDGEAT